MLCALLSRLKSSFLTVRSNGERVRDLLWNNDRHTPPSTRSLSKAWMLHCMSYLTLSISLLSSFRSYLIIYIYICKNVKNEMCRQSSWYVWSWRFWDTYRGSSTHSMQSSTLIVISSSTSTVVHSSTPTHLDLIYAFSIVFL